MKTKSLALEPLAKRYAAVIEGQLSCVDRLLIRGTLVECAHPDLMNWQIHERKVRLRDYAEWVRGYAEGIRQQAEKVAASHQLEIEFIRRVESFRKEDRVAALIRERGDHPGLVHIFSAMERCRTFKPGRDPRTGRIRLRWDSGKCLHLYFYFIDSELGLCFLRVQTWAPFTLQFYCNGHAWLERQLRAKGIGYQMQENAFVQIDSWEEAQALVWQGDSQQLHQKLDAFARQFTPLAAEFPKGWHWSIAQMEFSTDLVFRDAAALGPLYEELVRTSVFAIKANDVATFLGKRGLSPLYEGEARCRLQTRIEGTRIRHQLGPASLKMYDKGGRILRVETTCDNVAFFQHQRLVNKLDGTSVTKVACVRKTIHSLGLLRKLMEASNRRYLTFLSQCDDHRAGKIDLHRITASLRDPQGRCSRGFNLFQPKDLAVILALLRAEHHLTGVKNRYLRDHLPGWNSGQISRALKRLRLHGVLRKLGHRYKYFLTQTGQRLLVAALKLREFLLIPSLCPSA